MTNLITFFVRRFVFAISIFVAIIFFGLISSTTVGVDLLPNFELAFVSVTTVYEGAGSEEISRQISEPIEDAIASLPGINSLSSTSFEGFSFVVVEFTAAVDGDQAAIDVSQRVNAILGVLPEDAQAPSVQKIDPNEDPILNVAISAAGERLQDVQRYVEDQLEPKLQGVLGVADVSIVGAVERQIQVLLEPNVLELYSLTPTNVAQAIGANFSEVPLGSLTIAGNRVLFAGRNTASTAEEVAAVTIDSQRGIVVGDVGVVRDASADVDAYVRVNGEPVVLLEVQKQSGSNSVGAANGIRRELRKFDFPENYKARVIADTTPFIASTVEDTGTELLRSILIVGIIVLLFIGRLGSTFSVILAVPISFAGALIIFGILGFTYNIVTLLAVTVAVGLVVDDSIVIAETIDRYREQGYSSIDAVRLGTSEVSTAVLASTLSLLAVFLPISFLPGILGQFFAEFGLTLTATIVFSYLEALFFLTVRLAYLPNPLPPSYKDVLPLLKKYTTDKAFIPHLYRQPYMWFFMLVTAGGLYALGQFLLGWTLTSNIILTMAALALPIVIHLLRFVILPVGVIIRLGFEGTDRLVLGMREGYGRLLEAALKGANWVILVSFLLLVSAGFIAPQLGFNFTPPLDSGQVGLNINLAKGTALDTTNAVASRLENALLQRPEVDIVQISVGISTGDLGSVNTSERAEFIIELVPKRQRALDNRQLALVYKDIAEELLQDYPEAEINAAAIDNAGPPAVSDYEITLASNDLDALKERDKLARAVLEQSPYLTGIGSNFQNSVSERVFRLEASKLDGTGLAVAQVYNELRNYNVGIRAGNIRDEGFEVPIMVRVNPALVRDEQSLLSLPILSPVLQRTIPIGELGSFSLQEAPSTINRVAQIYTSSIGASLLPDSPPISQVKTEMKQLLVENDVFDDVVIEGQGVGLDLTGDLIFYTPIAFMLAFILNYLVLASQFNSFKFPIYILVTVPLALVGALWLFYLTGSSLDVNSVLGIVILTGLVTKSALLLLDIVVNQELQQEGEKLKDILIRAGKTRLRPILMTTTTLIAISIPLLLGGGDGSEFRAPLGLVIFGGVTTSSILALFVVPATFYRFERKRFDAAVEARRVE